MNRRCPPTDFTADRLQLLKHHLRTHLPVQNARICGAVGRVGIGPIQSEQRVARAGHARVDLQFFVVTQRVGASTGVDRQTAPMQSLSKCRSPWMITRSGSNAHAEVGPHANIAHANCASRVHSCNAVIVFLSELDAPGRHHVSCTNPSQCTTHGISMTHHVGQNTARPSITGLPCAVKTPSVNRSCLRSSRKPFRLALSLHSFHPSTARSQWSVLCNASGSSFPLISARIQSEAVLHFIA
jgi:hypothetical protein